MPVSLAQSLPFITGVLFVLALLLLAVALRLFRRSRTDVFWRRRRQAGQRGWRIFVLAVVLLAASALTCGLTGVTLLLDSDSDTPDDTSLAALPSATPTLIPSDTPAETLPDIPTDTVRAPDLTLPGETPTHNAAGTPSTPEPTMLTPPSTVVVIVTATQVLTPTPTVFPTFTPVVTPAYPVVTPYPYASLRITALDDQISDDLKPVAPRQVFNAQTTRLYLFVEFRSMTEGVMWRRELLHNGETIEDNTYIWGLQANGDGYFFFGSANGFDSGQYEVRVYIGSATEPASTMTFRITG